MMILYAAVQENKGFETWAYKGIGAAIAAYYWLQVRAARVRGNAILVSAEHWPELHALVQECQAKLGLKDLKAYVVQDLVLEQAGMRLSGEDCLLLRASMVDAALAKNDLQVLRFHIGRKCGQIAFGHYRFAANTLPGMGRLVYPLHAWYMRCQERSADRAGLWVAGDAALAHRGLAVLAAGVQIGGRLTPAAGSPTGRHRPAEPLGPVGRLARPADFLSPAHRESRQSRRGTRGQLGLSSARQLPLPAGTNRAAYCPSCLFR